MKDRPAEDSKQPDEPAKRVKRKQRRAANPRISLAPLTFEEALEALLKTPPPKKESGQVAKEGAPTGDEASERPAS
jgi:hypothetical protein